MEKDMYRIQYIDNTYQLVEWTDDEFTEMDVAISDEYNTTVTIDKCIYRLKDIRSIVYLPPVKEETKNEAEINEPETVMITNEGTYDKETYDLLVSLGYISDVGQERRVK